MRPAAVVGQKRRRDLVELGLAALGRPALRGRPTSCWPSPAFGGSPARCQHKQKTTLEGGLCLVELGGIEPPTSTLPVLRSPS